VRNFLSSAPLRGKLEYIETTSSRERVPHQIDFNWDPLVDPELWDAVERQLALTCRTRKRKESFPLRPFCTHCGAPYWGCTISGSDPEQSRRVYRHAPVDERGDPDMYQRFVAAGCIRYQLDAGVLEDALALSIGQERGSPEFEAQLRERMVDNDSYEKDAARLVADLGRERDGIMAKKKALALRIADPSFPPDFTDVLRETAQEFSNEQQEVEKKLERAKRARDTSHAAWSQASQIIEETRNITRTWDQLDLEERTLIFNHWVVAVGVAVDRIPGRMRGHPMTALVYLAPSPNSPKLLPLAPDSAVSSSSCTQWSSSEETAEESSALAAAPPTRPNAQAACPLTNGAGSASARASTGSASSDPQLPSETQRLRANPARPARRMAEPRENDSQASGSRAISSNPTSFGESVPGCAAISPGSPSTPCGSSPGPRAAYDASEAVLEKLRLNGHTSWQMSHP